MTSEDILDIIINFIATTPGNINYNIIREAITALVTHDTGYNFINLAPKGELDEVATGGGRK